MNVNKQLDTIFSQNEVDLEGHKKFMNHKVSLSVRQSWSNAVDDKMFQIESFLGSKNLF